MNEYSLQFFWNDWDFFVRLRQKKRLRVIYNGMCVYVVMYNGMCVYVVNYNGMCVYVVTYNGMYVYVVNYNGKTKYNAKIKMKLVQ